MSGSTDTGRSRVRFNTDNGGRSQSVFLVNDREGRRGYHNVSITESRRRRLRRPLPGYPSIRKFLVMEDVEVYLSHPKITCLLCGHQFKLLDAHLRYIHDTNTEEYKKKYNLPRHRGLVGTATLLLFRAHAIKRKLGHDEKVREEVRRRHPDRKQIPQEKRFKVRPKPELYARKVCLQCQQPYSVTESRVHSKTAINRKFCSLVCVGKYAHLHRAKHLCGCCGLRMPGTSWLRQKRKEVNPIICSSCRKAIQEIGG